MDIYLDNASTTRIDPVVMAAVQSCQISAFANAVSTHGLGMKAAKEVEAARSRIAAALNADISEIYFTSGGTESNNTVLQGLARKRGKKSRCVISKIEHPSVVETALRLQQQGAAVSFLSVDAEGIIDLTELKRVVTDDTFLVSVMQANNEIGTLQPVEEIGVLCRARGAYFHTDACQSFTKVRLDVQKQSVDFASLSAHKLHGPKGIGALYIRKGVSIEPVLHGGGQEGGTRSGTHNTEGIVGFAKAVESVDPADIEKMRALRDLLIKNLQENIPGVSLNGSSTRRLCNNVNVRIEGMRGKELVGQLSRRNIYVSAGAACASTKLTPSHVLRAIGLSEQEALSSLRLSLSKWTTQEEVEYVVQALKEIIQTQRRTVYT